MFLQYIFNHIWAWWYACSWAVDTDEFWSRFRFIKLFWVFTVIAQFLLLFVCQYFSWLFWIWLPVSLQFIDGKVVFKIFTVCWEIRSSWIRTFHTMEETPLPFFFHSGLGMHSNWVFECIAAFFSIKISYCYVNAYIYTVFILNFFLIAQTKNRCD